MTQTPNALVLDASVASKWYLTDEAGVSDAATILQAFRSGTLALIAPDHIRYEVPSAITVASRMRPPRLTDDQAERAIRTFLALGVPTVNDDGLILAARAAAKTHGCAFYDGPYVALARRHGIPLIIADTRLYQHIRREPWVIWLSNWMPPVT